MADDAEQRVPRAGTKEAWMTMVDAITEIAEERTPGVVLVLTRNEDGGVQIGEIHHGLYLGEMIVVLGHYLQFLGHRIDAEQPQQEVE